MKQVSSQIEPPGVLNGTRRLRLAGFFPLAGFGGAEYRVDHVHIADAVFERHGNFAAIAHGPREEVGLKSVLVTSSDFVRLDAGAKQIAAIVERDMAGSVWRRVKRNLDVEPATRAEDLHALIRDKLSAAGEEGLPG